MERTALLAANRALETTEQVWEAGETDRYTREHTRDSVIRDVLHAVRREAEKGYGSVTIALNPELYGISREDAAKVVISEALECLQGLNLEISGVHSFSGDSGFAFTITWSSAPKHPKSGRGQHRAISQGDRPSHILI